MGECATVLLHAARLDAPRGGDGLTAVLEQRQQLYRRLGDAGAILTSLSAPRCVDDVFVRERLLVCDDGLGARALPCGKHAYPADGEHGGLCKALFARGIRVEPRCEASLSGTDVVWIPGRGALLGIGNASEHDALPALARFLGAEVSCVELADPRFASLDMAVAALDDGTVLACRSALAPWAAHEIEAWLDRAPIDVPLADALEGGLRFVQAGRRIFLGHGAPNVQAILAERGYGVSALPLERIQRLGRGASTLVARLVHVDRALGRTGSNG
jgi:N-dimethylarginine dimethylaminohydrolase